MDQSRLGVPSIAVSRFTADRQASALVPDLKQVAVGIAGEQVRLAGHELALLDDRASGASDALGGPVDRVRLFQTKAEVGDAAALPHRFFGALEDDDVARTRRLRLKELGSAVHRDHSEDGLVLRERALDVMDAERKVREAVRAYCGSSRSH